MRKLTLLLACALLSLGAQAPKEKETELDQFQGTWKTIKANLGGTEAPAGDLKDSDMTIKGDQAVYVQDPKQVATLKIDASKKPAEIDFVIKDKKVDRGIYRFIDKDTLELCVETEGGERPKEFAAPKDSNRILFVLKRGK